MGEKMDFKKINTINWNITREEKAEEGSGFVELPTIKTPSSCEIVPVECKELDEDEVAEEMDDNVPYKSDSDSLSEKNVDDTLLLEEVP